MKVLTEAALRAEFKDGIPDEYYVEKNIIITPSARQFLSEKRVELIVGKRKEEFIEMVIKKEECEFKYALAEGIYVNKKSEYMTQLYKERLVYKNHPRIMFRGMIDSFQSSVMEAQIMAENHKSENLLKDLQEILDITRLILRAEVIDEELKPFTLIGLDEDGLREQSHNPKKYFKSEHILPHYSMGPILVRLNSLRSEIREVEVCAVNAFSRDYEIERLDIIRALNRLSSALYIMMLRQNTGLYK